jgi:serine/threonine protein kinase/DNA-binding beta-propeller fold protein YncE
MAEITIGSVLAGYRIEGLAGEGGMGRVYRATQIALSRQVAVKLIAPELASEPDFRARFTRESRLTAAIEHPNVIPVYEAGEADGRLFIAMRWVEGTDLRSVILTEGRLEPGRAVAIAEQVAAALDAAHMGGLVHRDVKPANVMLTSTHGQEHVYLTDFGLTKRAGSETALTRTGAFVGTPDYMPPEQIKGERADARTDVYALGCLLFHALTGRTPYDRDTEVAKMYAQLHDPPPKASETAPGTPPVLDAVIARALAKDADERYPSAGDLGRAARAALTGGDPSQPERSLATGLAAPGATELSPPPATAAPPSAPPAAAAPPSAQQPASPAPAATPPPASTPPASAPVATPPPGAPEPRAPRRSGVFPILLAAALIVGVTITLAAAGVFDSGDGGGGQSFSDQPAGGQDGGGDGGGQQGGAAAPKVLAKAIPAGEGPDGIAVDGNRVWVSNSRGNALVRIDTDTDEPLGDAIPVGSNPDEVEAREGVVWVANTGDGTVTRLEGGATKEFAVGQGPEGLSLGKSSLWVANGDSDTVTRIDLISGTPQPPIQVGNKPIGILAGETFVWVTNSFSSSVTRLDPATGEVVGTTEDVGKNIRSVAEAFGFIWVSSAIENGTVQRLDPQTGEKVGPPIPVGNKPKEMAAAGGYLWIVNETDGTVVRIDPKTFKRVGAPIQTGQTPVGLAYGAKSLWVSNNGSDTVTRIDPGKRG